MNRDTVPGVFLLFLAICMLFSPAELRAEAYVGLGGTVKFFSSVFTEDQAGSEDIAHEAGDFALNRLELRLKLDGYASDNVSFRSRVHFIHTINPGYQEFSEIESGSGFSSTMQDLDLYLKEASFTLMEFLLDGMDLIVGRQRVRWGTSDE